MKNVILTLPQGLIDWAEFDPAHTDERPLFSGQRSLPDGTSVVGYLGELPLPEWVPVSLTITDVSPVDPADVVHYDPDYHGTGTGMIGVDMNVPFTITFSYTGPDAEWATPVTHPRGGTANFFTKAINNVITLTVSLPDSGDWEVTQELLNGGLEWWQKIEFSGLLIKAGVPTV